MIIVMKAHARAEQIERVVHKLKELDLAAHVSAGLERTVIGAIGDDRAVQPAAIECLDGVDSVHRVLKQYKIVARDGHPGGTVVDVGGVRIGGSQVQVIAGPCSVETPEQMACAALGVAHSGTRLMRGGAFKPRTSPYAFQGRGIEGLKMLTGAAREHGLKVVTELMDVRMLDAFLEHGVDVIQIGTRNMQNFDLLKEVGKVHVPVILKRGMSATLTEWLMAAEYIAAAGNHSIILCERGIRSFESAYRNVLDLSAIPYLKRETHLPVIVDPSHSAGKAWMVSTLASAAIAAGADGLLVETHPAPAEAWCDGEQALSTPEFDAAMQMWRRVAQAVGRSIAAPREQQHERAALVA